MFGEESRIAALQEQFQLTTFVAKPLNNEACLNYYIKFVCVAKCSLPMSHYHLILLYS